MSLPDLAATEAAGRRLARDLAPGAVVAFSGGLGAGKTTMIRSVAAALDVPAELVTSPSYTLVNTYEGRLPVHHVDLYRLDDLAAVAALDLDEILFGDGVCLVEWPEIAFRLLPRETRLVRIDLGRSAEAPRRLRYWYRLPAPEILRSFPSPQVE